MSIVAADLKTFGSFSMPTDDVGASGGDISLTTLVDDMPLAATDTITYVSSSASDVSPLAVTVKGRDATGIIQTETKVLTGTTPVVGTQSFERVLQITLNGDSVGNVSLNRTTTPFTLIYTIAPLIRKNHRLDYDSSSSSVEKKRYEKIFKKNTHGTLTLTNAKIQLQADPQARYTIAVSSAKQGDTNGDESLSNRLTPGSGPTFVTGAFVGVGVDVDVPSGFLAAGQAVGVWALQTLPINDPAFKNTITTQLAGTSV